MKAGSSISARRRLLRGRRVTYLLLALTTATVAIAVYAISAALAAPARKHILASPPAPRSQRTVSNVDASPSAVEFADDVVGTTTAYANAHGETARITDVDCVQASSVHYMCSYAVNRANSPRECHLMQATWTPNSASTYTVTLAGRVRKCDTLREALDSVR